MDIDAAMYDDAYDGTAIDTKPNDGETKAERPPNSMRDNALHLKGVDDMSTNDVQTYVALYATESKPRIEWIDDTSLNLVYYTADDARIALSKLTPAEPSTVNTEQCVAAHDNTAKPDSRLSVRYAMDSDKKERGAKDRSRWYLFHPEDDPDSKVRRHGRGGRRGEPYARDARHRPERSTSGAKEGQDLFADRISFKTQPSEETDLFAGKTKASSGEDLFAARVSEAAKSSQRGKRQTSTTLPSDDLFAQKSREGLSLADRISKDRGDLFADRLGTTKDLASRISGGPIRNKGISIRGSSKRAKASDMF